MAVLGSALALCVAVAMLLAHAPQPACGAAAATTWKKFSRMTQWQWQLDDNGSITRMPAVKVYDIDMDTAADQIPVLRKAIPGVQIICYISVGTWESYRKAQDAARGIKASDWTGIIGKSYSPPFQDEKWLDIRNPKTRAIMAKRFAYAKKIGCNGVEPDNTAAYAENTGFPITKAQSVAYSLWIATTVHKLGMSVGLKNSQGMLPSLHRYYDWFLNEQCNEDNSCGVYKQVGTQKPVLGAEYCDATSQDNGRTQDPGCYCPGMLQAGFNWLIKNTDLNAKRRTCKDYCAKHACPGRAGRRNCNASKASVCTTAFA